MKFSRNILLVLSLSFIPLLFLLISTDLLHTHDGLVHLPRIAAFFKALTQGQIPVRWAGDLNYGYGMPLFNFIYHLPYLVASLFLFLGVGLVWSFKLSLATSFLLSGIFMYLFARSFFNSSAEREKKALLVTVFYQFAPFRFVELLTRGSFGEVYTYTFLPLVLYGLIRIFKKQRMVDVAFTAFATGLLILSHNAISLIFFGVIVLFILLFSKTKRNALLGFISLVLGLGLSAYYFIPAILEHKYTYGDLFMKNIYLSHFPPIQNFFIPNTFNSKSLWTEGIAVEFGLFHVIAILLSLYLLWKKKLSQKSLYVFCFLLIASAIFLMQPVSKSLWVNIKLLRQFQFPWRLLAVTTFATSLLSVSFFSFKIFKEKLFYVVLGLAVVVTIAYWRGTAAVDTINEEYYWNFPLNTTYYGETDVIWSAGPAKSYPKNRVEIISGKGEVGSYKKRSNLHTYIINAQSPINIVDNTQYFPGWKAYVDEKEVPIQFQDQNWRGIITFKIPPGRHNVKVMFGETKLRLISDLVSILSVVILFGLLIWNYVSRRFSPIKKLISTDL